MPFLLLCGMGFSAFFSALGTLMLALMLPIVLFGDGPYIVDEVEVDRTTFLRASLPFLLVMPAMVGGYAAIAYGLWRERAWTRKGMIAFWAVLGVGMAVSAVAAPAEGESTVGAFAGSIAMFLLCGGLAAWYLYGKESVVEYYDAISEQEAARREQPAS